MYEHCLEYHIYEDDYYGETEAPDPEMDEDEFRVEYFYNDINLEDWQKFIWIVSELQPEKEAVDVFIKRDIDFNYN